ncbi:hypothetical protein LJR230_004588 [Trinickia sp. LjRoot230]|uniref:hypothetical protein n=1 Tax=Trinickia sp. LjRoot230 TaxID=3342288 RepID=UPI003ECEA196
MHVTNGDGHFPDEYGVGQPSEQEGGQAAAGPGKPPKPLGALGHLMNAVGLRAQRGASAQPAEPSHPVTEPCSAADTPAAEPAPATALAAAGHALPGTFDSLYQLCGMSSSAGEEVTISVNGKLLVDWQQLPTLLTENCHVSIDLGHCEGGPNLDLLRVLVALNLALQRETRAKVTLAVPDGSYQQALRRVSSEEYGPDGLTQERLRFEELPPSNLSSFFKSVKRA